MSGNNFEADQKKTRSMTPIIGNWQRSISNASTATTSLTDYYVGRWASPALSTLGGTSIAADTWTLNFAALESDASASFPVPGTAAINLTMYVWRPLTKSMVDVVINSVTAAVYQEPSAPNATRGVLGLTADSCDRTLAFYECNGVRMQDVLDRGFKVSIHIKVNGNASATPTVTQVELSNAVLDSSFASNRALLVDDTGASGTTPGPASPLAICSSSDWMSTWLAAWAPGQSSTDAPLASTT